MRMEGSGKTVGEQNPGRRGLEERQEAGGTEETGEKERKGR